MLETGRVGRVTGDGNVDILLPHDCNALAYVICTVAVHAAADTIGVAGPGDFLDLSGVVVELGLDIGESVDAADDLCCILSESVEDDAERLLANLVCHFGDLDCAFCCCI